MHNNALALMANYGIIVTMVIYRFIYELYRKISWLAIYPNVSICCIGFTAVMIASWTEATFYFSPAFLFFSLYLGWGNYFCRKRIG